MGSDHFPCWGLLTSLSWQHKSGWMDVFRCCSKVLDTLLSAGTWWPPCPCPWTARCSCRAPTTRPSGCGMSRASSAYAVSTTRVSFWKLVLVPSLKKQKLPSVISHACRFFSFPPEDQSQCQANVDQSCRRPSRWWLFGVDQDFDWTDDFFSFSQRKSI